MISKILGGLTVVGCLALVFLVFLVWYGLDTQCPDIATYYKCSGFLD